MSRILKIQISRYDESIKEPPFRTIIFDEVEILSPTNDFLGEELWLRLQLACNRKGYRVKFYTTSTHADYHYEAVVF
jgi:hypothetical protein